MSVFSQGNRIKVGYSKVSFGAEALRWRRSDIDAIRPFPAIVPPLTQLPNGVREFFGTGLHLILSADGSASLGSVRQLNRPFTETFRGNPAIFYSLSRYTFFLSQLSDIQRERLIEVTGYPFILTAKRIDTEIPSEQPIGLQDGVVSWSINDRGEFEAATNSALQPYKYSDNAEVDFALWLGGPLSGGQRWGIVNSDGSPYNWKARDDLSELFRQGQSGGSASVNAVSDIEFITFPGRTDSDGSIQDTSVGPDIEFGPLELNSPLAQLQEIEPNIFFDAKIISSAVYPQVTNLLDGSVVDKSKHRVELLIEDRSAAGFDDTPRQINLSDFPQFFLGGRGYWAESFVDGPNSSVTLSVTSVRNF